MKTPHTEIQRGKKVRVELKDGTVFIDHFENRTRGKVCEFRVRGRIRAGDIKAFSPYRALQEVSAHRRI
jgi:hypothetical protein